MTSGLVIRYRSKSGLCSQNMYARVVLLLIQRTVANVIKTKKDWVEHIEKGEWGGDVRARVKFRKREGREPTEEDIDEMDTISKGEVTLEEVREAFDKGEEVSLGNQPTWDFCSIKRWIQRLYTWSMKCRGYDERFQRWIWNEASAKVKKEE